MARLMQSANVSDIIDERRLSPFQIRTVTLCGMVLFADGFDAQIIGYLAPSIAVGTGIPVSSLGPVFSASLVGLMIAAMGAGPIADRWGRKWPIVLSTMMLAVFSFWTAHATSFNQLLILRFLTGLGLGGALPNCVSLASEYVPKRLMAVLVAILFCGLPVGGFVCGLMSSAMLPIWGWQSLFYVGAALPFAMCILLVLLLPESVQFLSIRGADPRRIAKLMSPIAPDLADSHTGFSPASQSDSSKGLPVKYLFKDGRALGTILLWIPNFMNLLLMYVIVNWLPALLTESGMSVSDGVTATSIYSLGGIVGTLAEGFLIKVGGAYRILLAEFGLCSIFIALIARISDSFGLVIVMAFSLGFMVTGAQAGLNVLAARFYPTSIRSTGVGWALGIGRIGSIAGPLIAGMLLSAGWQPWRVLIVGAVPSLLALVSVLLGRRIQAKESLY